MRQRARAYVRIKLHPTDGSWLEGVLARGDRSLANLIEHAYQNGARFDSWEECMKWEIWAAAFEATNTDPERFLGTIPVRARLPWDHIHVAWKTAFSCANTARRCRTVSLRHAEKWPECSCTTRTSKTPRPMPASSSVTTAAWPVTWAG